MVNQRDAQEPGARDWPSWGRHRYGLNNRGWRIACGWASLFLFFMIDPAVGAFDDGRPVWLGVLLVLDVVVYAVCYVVFMYRGAVMGHGKRFAAVGVVAVLGSGIAVITGDPTELTYMTYAIALALMLLPMVWSWPFGLLVAAVQIVLEQVLLGEVPWGNTSTLVLVTVGLGTFYRLINTTVQLRIAQDEVKQLAVADERARLARDLHDVLGHSLTTITVKSGLARRVLESGAEREQAVAEVRDVEDLARQALAEIRSTVSGYRTASLAAELVGARQALTAAGITADLPHAVDDVAAPLREPFAYVLREAVTNVVRHSGASRCEVRLGTSWIEVRDDGAGNLSTVDTSGGGSGLAGLSERLAAVGARLRAEPVPGGGFVLRAERPGAHQAWSTPPSAEHAAEGA